MPDVNAKGRNTIVDLDEDDEEGEDSGLHETTVVEEQDEDVDAFVPEV